MGAVIIFSGNGSERSLHGGTRSPVKTSVFPSGRAKLRIVLARDARKI
ncbi:hypothetical protein KCP75_22770 [Salmonella enterica subsp. enterica]|nr:hypothetical protein KCP75_22770 [Salmonella enterica subsp. enterica]